MDFVNFDIAKKLKEKGFLEKCFATYTPYSRTFKFNEINVDKRPASYYLNIKEFRECYNYYKDSDIDAPTISQVLKWLREEKHLHLEIKVGSAWAYDIYKIASSGVFVAGIEGSLYVYTSYELAALAGIEYVLDNLI